MSDAMFNFPNSYMNQFYGYKFIENIHMVDVEHPEYHEQRRTWKERLFTLPWRPFKKTKTVTTFPPLKDYYLINKNILMGHPVAIRSLISTIERGDKIA